MTESYQKMIPGGSDEYDAESGVNLISESPSGTSDQESDSLRKIQLITNILSHVLALLAVAWVVLWICMMGGLSWSYENVDQVFNWHPLLMVTAFAFMTVASLSFRNGFVSSRPLRKTVHALSWTTAAFCGMVAIIAVVRTHNDPITGFYANLCSLHSWVAVTVILLYVLQLVYGTYAFVWPRRMTPQGMTAALKLHKFLGPLLYNGVGGTILLGIQEIEVFQECEYEVEGDTPDLFPPQNFGRIPLLCRVSHFLGLLVLAMVLCTNFTLYDFGKREADHLR